LCQLACPNGTIRIITKQITTEDGKPKKVLDKHLYDIGSCTFCDLCVQSCNFDALAWSQNFEHTVFTRSKLVKQLNKPGSTVAEKKAPATPPNPAPAAAPAKEVTVKEATAEEDKAEPTVESNPIQQS
jgi:NADH-quinone oxidoreductase subunit I